MRLGAVSRIVLAISPAASFQDIGRNPLYPCDAPSAWAAVRVFATVSRRTRAVFRHPRTGLRPLQAWCSAATTASARHRDECLSSSSHACRWCRASSHRSNRRAGFDRRSPDCRGSPRRNPECPGNCWGVVRSNRTGTRPTQLRLFIFLALSSANPTSNPPSARMRLSAIYAGCCESQSLGEMRFAG